MALTNLGPPDWEPETSEGAPGVQELRIADTGPGDRGEAACGCVTGAPAVAWLALLPPLVARRRR